MIRLKHPANMNGVLVPAGTVMQMDPELAQKFISAGTAEVFMPGSCGRAGAGRGSGNGDRRTGGSSGGGNIGR